MTLKRSLSDSTLCFAKEALRFKLHRLMANNRMNEKSNQSRQSTNNIPFKLQSKVIRKQLSTTHSNEIAPEKRKLNNSILDVSNIIKNNEIKNLLESPPSSPSSLASSTAPVKTNSDRDQFEKKWCRKSTSLPHIQNNVETILRVQMSEHGIKKCKVILKRINVNEFKNPSNETKASNENKIKQKSRGRSKIGKTTKNTCKI